MQESTITIDVQLDPDKVPSKISWKASGSTVEEAQQAKAMMLAFWDSADKTAMRIDLWTKEMMVDEMADFFYQTFMTMADTYHRATRNDEMVKDMKDFARDFYKKFRDQQMKENAAG
ncbi:gliding motility protein GldC [Flavihumibacter fluvii]|jgi:gliding motility-associated protein GldC|uniref:gliding motility protein GldC n=1 Tax=Flavihumibacter fluvii TaxID=2838157 RepID=UPI001BDDFAC6|nr:gliding motility protein GldC [Flavihumibacter fluvii]ULQ52261.1 gliding motility protein GldC [Flavihumibacter fluvii]